MVKPRNPNPASADADSATMLRFLAISLSVVRASCSSVIIHSGAGLPENTSAVIRNTINLFFE